MRRSPGSFQAQSPAISMVAAPPRTTEPTGPSQAAVTPDSNSPSWFEVPMNRVLTALTRPRIASGVAVCTSVLRVTTLIMSQAPTPISAAKDSGTEDDRPNTIVAALIGVG